MKKKILIFEDDQYSIDLLTSHLQNSGYLTLISKTSQNIITQIKDFIPDLIIMNNYIPSTGGITATKILKNDYLYRAIPIILVSPKRNVRDMQLSCGADEYLLKPFSLQRLNKLLLKHLGAGR